MVRRPNQRRSLSRVDFLSPLVRQQGYSILDEFSREQKFSRSESRTISAALLTLKKPALTIWLGTPWSKSWQETPGQIPTFRCCPFERRLAPHLMLERVHEFKVDANGQRISPASMRHVSMGHFVGTRPVLTQFFIYPTRFLRSVECLHAERGGGLPAGAISEFALCGKELFGGQGARLAVMKRGV